FARPARAWVARSAGPGLGTLFRSCPVDRGSGTVMRSSPRAIAERIADTFEPLMRPHFTEGNRIRLLASAQPYFQALIAAIAAARRAVHLETYIFADDRR